MIHRLFPALMLASAGLLAGCQPAGQAPAGTAADAAPAPAAKPAPAPGPAPAPAPAASAAAAPAPTAATQPDAAKPASPSLVVQTFDGKKFDLAEHRGKWVVVNYWATWCNPCLKEIPDLAAFDQSRADVEVIGLAYEEIERADMEAFLKQHVISYPIAVVDLYKPPGDFGIPKGLPMTYLIAPDGKVARQFLGPVGSADLAAAIVAYRQPAVPPSS